MDVGRMVRPALSVALAAGLVASLTGCVVVQRVERDDRVDRESADLQGAESVEVAIDMGAGQLSLDGASLAADGLMDAEFEYNVPSLKPRVEYEVDDGVGSLSIRQPSGTSIGGFGEYRYVWDIGLAEGVPMEIGADMGAGQADLDLSDIDLVSLDVDMGAGETTIDLSGDYGHDVRVKINGGAGQLTVRLPESMGVRVEVDQGIGEVVANGFTIRGDRYVNDAYDEAEDFVDVDIDAGVGQINLILAD